MQFKFKTEQGGEKISQILKEKHLELLNLLFGNFSTSFNKITVKISEKKDNITRIQINFKLRIQEKNQNHEINFRISSNCLLFSLKVNQYLKRIFREEIDVFKFSEYLGELGITVEAISLAKPFFKNGTCGKQHTFPRHEKGKKLSEEERRKRRGGPKKLSRKEKKKLKK